MDPLRFKTLTSTRHQSGHMDPIVYFENERGVISMPPSTEYAKMIKDLMSARGFMLREASTLSQVQDLQRRMQKQEQDLREGRLEKEQRMFDQVKKERRSRLLQRRNSSSCSAFERDMIDEHIKLQDEKEAARRKQERAEHHYFEALEFDASSHHMMEAAHNVPDMAAETCMKCHSYRRIKGLTICARCAYEIKQQQFEASRG